jgi:putative transposase
MIFEQGHLYHIYNQGNNQQKIFFTRNNYLFFLNKIKIHIIPFADIISWCLMPNHFHLMIYVLDKAGIDGDSLNTVKDTHPMTNIDLTLSHRMSNTGSDPTLSHRMSKQTFNQSIAVMLRSYTRAINKQEDRSGTLFKPHTKAECLTKNEGNTPSFINTGFGTKLNVQIPEKEYSQVCFNYIHNNPVKAGLVDKPEDWEFSSYRDYCGLREGKLINRKRAEEFELKIIF